MFTGSTDVPGKVHFESAWKYSWCCLTVLSSLCCLTVSVSLCYPHFAVSFGCPYVSISCSLCLFLVCCVCAETLSDTAQVAQLHRCSCATVSDGYPCLCNYIPLCLCHCAVSLRQLTALPHCAVSVCLSQCVCLTVLSHCAVSLCCLTVPSHCVASLCCLTVLPTSGLPELEPELTSLINIANPKTNMQWLVKLSVQALWKLAVPGKFWLSVTLSLHLYTHTITRSHTHTQCLSLVLVVMI